MRSPLSCYDDESVKRVRVVNSSIVLVCLTPINSCHYTNVFVSKTHLDLKEMAPPSQLLARELTSKNNNLRKFHQNFNSIRTLDFLYINFKT